MSVSQDYLMAGHSALDRFAFDEAENLFSKALLHKQQDIHIYLLLADVCIAKGELAQAESYYKAALLLQPGSYLTQYNYSILLLKLGRYEEGWPMYLSRHSPEVINAIGLRPPPCPFKFWNGESLEGRSLLVWPEQGLGDCIQFARYFPVLKALGLNRLTVACWPPLTSLFRSIPSIDECIELNGSINVAHHDYWCYYLDPPAYLGTTIERLPKDVPYLSDRFAHVNGFAEKFPSNKLRVGLAWRGNVQLGKQYGKSTDKLRSIPLCQLRPILENTNAFFVSLQKETIEPDELKDLPREFWPVNAMENVKDFADTATIIRKLDLVITVDTAVAHLAGSMNKPVWILSRLNGCWRWMLDRDDSPWYPSARLFRQERLNDWDSVINRISNELMRLAKNEVDH